jgi:protein-disulfide isomerase
MSPSAKLKPPVGANDHVLGSAKAPVTIVEYGDYECPYCGEAYPVTKALQKRLGDQLRFVFRNFPLAEAHPHAEHAAEAAEAAGAQGKFWEMHDLLYENQDALDDEDLVRSAKALRLDVPRFVKEMEAHTYAERVREDFSSGVRSGVNGTPTFFINGARHDGPFDLRSMVAAIQKAVLARRSDE